MTALVPAFKNWGQILYDGFKKWYEDILWDEYTSAGYDGAVGTYYTLTMSYAILVVRPAMRIRKLLTDELLKRFLNEVYLFESP